MTYSQSKQLNTFEIKSEISRLVKALENSTILVDTREFETLDAQENKDNIIKLLFKEFNLCNEETLPVIKMLLLRYCNEKDLLTQLENIIFNPKNDNNVKLHAIELISTFDQNWHEKNYDSYLIYDEELVQKETKELLESAVDNPELQMDFLDFFNAIPPKDQKMLIESLIEDQKPEDLANILTPIFLSYPNTEIGTIALEMLGDTKSKYAYQALNQVYKNLKENVQTNVKKCINKLKLSGAAFGTIPIPNTDLCNYYLIPPDGEGNSTLLYKEQNPDNTIRLVGVVFDDYTGIRDCLGFNSISEFESSFLVEKLTGTDYKVEISSEIFKMLLNEAETLNYKKSAPPYEYNCWKKIFVGIEAANININEFLAQQLNKKELSSDEIINILNSEITIPWFYTPNFGDETEFFFKALDKNLQNNNIENFDINKFIQENTETVFYKEEKENWISRICLTAYGKIIANEKDIANELFNLTTSEKAMNSVYDFVLKQSIFQYFLKIIAEENYTKYSKTDAENILTYLEHLWGFYV